MDTKKLLKHVPWALLGILGAFCLAVVALRRGEHVSALWIVVASVSVYLWLIATTACTSRRRS
jgi:branched-subunit amino acid transport protein AzlD